MTQIIVVGPSDTSYKSVSVALHCCPLTKTIDNSHWIGNHHGTEQFAVHIKHGICTVQRQDSPTGWTFDLIFEVDTMAPWIPSPIEKNIYVCFKDMEAMQHYAARWIELNPSFTLRLFDDCLCEEFLAREFSPLYAIIFRWIPDGPIKADFWRICVIYRYGGFYVDVDIEPLEPLSTWIQPIDEFVTCLSSYPGSYNPHFIMAARYNDILRRCILQYLAYYADQKPYTYWGWSIVGIFDRTIGFDINHGREGIFYIHNTWCRFFQEQRAVSGRQFCTVEGRVVLSNRYQNYSNHGFT